MTARVKKFLPALLALVLASSLALVPGAVSASPGILHVPSDDYPTIQSAIDAASPGDTILVAAGTYTEQVEVNKQLTLIGDVAQPSNVVVDAGGSGSAITLAVDGCVLQGFKAQNGNRGIYLDGSNANTLTNNIANSNTSYGIYLDSSNNNTLTENTVSGNNDCGIKLDGSNNNTLTGNTVTGNNIGIQIQPSVDASTISINFNNIYGNTSYGVDNASDASVNAENNWWGANDGPGTSPGSGDLVSDNVGYDPWIVLGVSPNPASIVADGSSTSTITADMTIDSDGEDASASGHIPDGTQIIFTTDKGSIGSLEATKETANGKATATLTSSTTGETATVTAKAPPYTDAAKDSTTVNFIPSYTLDHFTFDTISSPQTAAVAFSITITAKDQYENTVTSYTGTNTLSDTTGTITPDSTGNFTNGVWTGNVTITKAQTGVTITTTGADKSGTSNSFDVAAGSLDHIVISPDTASITAGDTQAYTAEAFDIGDNSLGDVTNDTTFEIEAGAGGSWAANVYTSEEIGTWIVTGTCSDKSDTAALTVTTAGSLPPTVSIASPEDGYFTTDSTVTIEGTVVATPALSEVTLTVNGASKTITVSNGAFSKKVILPKGVNTITVSASNLAGSDSDSITVSRNSEPVVDITSPLDGTICQTTLITVEGTIDALPGITEATLTLNGTTSTITVTDGAFSQAVNLVGGENAIVVSTTNIAGTGTSPTITVTLSKEPSPQPLPLPSPSPPSPPLSPPPPAPPSSTINWWLVSGILGGIALITFVVSRKFFPRY